MAYSGPPSKSKTLSPEEIAAQFQRNAQEAARAYKTWVRDEKITLANMARTQEQIAQDVAIKAKAEAIRQTNEFVRNSELASRQLAITWASSVGAAILGGNIATNAEFLRAIALGQAEVNATIAKQMADLKLRQVTNAEMFEAYVAAVGLLASTGFTLYVDTQSGIPDIFRGSGMYRRFAGRLQKSALKNIISAFGETVMELCERADQLTPKGVAWPLGYSRRLYEQANWLINKSGKLDLGTGSVESWRVSLDFNELLGDPGYLMAAGHLGALLSNQEEKLFYKQNQMRHKPNTNWRSRIDAGRVTTLPSPEGEGSYKNPAYRRYQFFLAMAVRKQSVFYGPYQSREELVKHKRKTTPKILRRLTDRLADLETQEDKLADETFSNLTDLRRTTENMAKKRKLMDDIQETKQEMRFRAENKRRGRGIPISKTAWQRTVNARLHYWEKNRVAPMWYYLEFGQLRWAPIIPPMGFTYMFLTKARVYIDRLIKRAFDEELARGGAYRDKRGRLRASGTPIYFGDRRGQKLRKGTPLKSSPFYRDLANIDKAEKQAVRNRDEALAVASGLYHNRFNPFGTIVSPLRQRPRPQVAATSPYAQTPREAPSYPIWDMDRFDPTLGRVPIADPKPSTLLTDSRLLSRMQERESVDIETRQTQAEHEAENRKRSMLRKLMVLAAGGPAAFSRLTPEAKLDLLHKVRAARVPTRIHKPYRAENAPNWTRGEKKRVRRKKRLYRRRRTFDENGNLISDEEINERY